MSHLKGHARQTIIVATREVELLIEHDYCTDKCNIINNIYIHLDLSVSYLSNCNPNPNCLFQDALTAYIGQHFNLISFSASNLVQLSDSLATEAN